MATSLSMASLRASLPSVGVSRRTSGASFRRISTATNSLTLGSFCGLRQETALISSPVPQQLVLTSNGTRVFAMRHAKRVPRLGRPADQRKALVRSLTTELLRHGRIKTTHTRAKAIRKYVDKAINLAKGGSLHERRQALAFIYDKQIVKTMFDQVPLAKEFTSRNSGYTRIIRTMPRRGDNAPMAYIELVEDEANGTEQEEDEEEE